jgi:hypothetical protein
MKQFYQLKKAGLLLLVLFATQKISAQYCTPPYTSGGCNNGAIISNFSLGIISNPTGTVCNTSSYVDYTSLATATLTPNQSFTASVSVDLYSGGVDIWIDFNDNFIFEANEKIGYSSSTISFGTTEDILLNIPVSATPGVHRLRIRLVESTSGGAIDPCSSYSYGETEDYQVFIETLPPCSVSPNGLFAILNPTLTCINSPINLSLSGVPSESSITYQWQQSIDGINWLNINTDLSNPFYTVPSQSVTTQYRAIATCTAVAAPSFTTPINSVNQIQLGNCYCIPQTMSCNNDYISAVNYLGPITDATLGCVSNGYEDRTYITGTQTLTAGQTYSYSIDLVSLNPYGYSRLSYWIDANQNGIFDSYEQQVLSTSTFSFSNISGNITIPSSALGGETKIRLKYENDNSVITGTNSCVYNGFYGETIDYVVNVIAAPICTGTPTAGNVFSNKSSVCQNESYNLDLNGTSQVSGLSFQWQKSTNGTNGWTNIGNPQSYVPTSIATQSATTYYRNLVTCLNSSLTANSSTLAVNQKLATECYCAPNEVYCEFTFISNLSFSDLSDAPSCNSLTGLTQSTLTANVNANQTYTFSADVTSGGDFGYVGVWIDYDKDGSFEDNEFSYIDSTCCLATTNTILIPFTAQGGLTGMRVQLKKPNSYFNNEIPSFNPCYSDEYDAQYLDYKVNITPVASCSATPNSGITVSSNTLVCSSTEFTLNLAGNSINTGISYQWQSSSNNVTWTNMSSPQNFVPFEVSGQTTATYYRCVTTCIASSQTSTSTPIFIGQNILFSCYCIPAVTTCMNGDGQIVQVEIANLNNISGCSSNGYTNYSGSVPNVTLTPGNGYSFTVTPANTNNESAYAWVDFDQNGTFDDTEYFYLGQTFGSTSNIISFINIPSNTQQGLTKMRVRLVSDGFFGSQDACNSYVIPPRINPNIPQDNPFSNNSETEDYNVFFTAPSCSSVNIPPILAIANETLICAGATTTLDVSPSIPDAIGFTFQWYESTDDLSFNPIGSPISTSSITLNPVQPTYYKMTAVCNSSPAATTNTPNLFIDIKPNPTVSITANTPTICTSQTVTLTGAGAVTYTWSTSSTTETISATPLVNTTYTVNGTGTNGCIGSSAITVSVGLASNIQGTVTSSGNPVTGAVILFKYEPMLTKFDTSGVQAIAVNGSYNFPSVLFGTYIVMAVPTATNLQVTYGFNGLGWKDANLINHTCITDNNQNIEVVPFATIGSGPGLMSGQIVEGIGFGQKPNGTLAPTAPGNPIGGIIVKGGKNPGGNFFTQTVTDASGNYTLSALPVNNQGEEYFILVDIPGLDTNGTYERRITSVNNVFTGLNFVVGSQKIDTIADVSVKSTHIDESSFSVYPNPAKDKFTIDYTINIESSSNIELVDILGKTIKVINKDKLLKPNTYKNDVDLNDVQSGIYFLKFSLNNQHQTIKLIVTH